MPTANTEVSDDGQALLYTSRAYAHLSPTYDMLSTSLYAGFEDVGKRMLIAWGEGVNGLREQRVYAVGD